MSTLDRASILPSAFFLFGAFLMVPTFVLAQETTSHNQVTVTTPVTNGQGVSVDFYRAAGTKSIDFTETTEDFRGYGSLMEMGLGVSGLNSDDKRFTGHFRYARVGDVRPNDIRRGFGFLNLVDLEATHHNIRTDLFGFRGLDINGRGARDYGIHVFGIQWDRDRKNAIVRLFPISVGAYRKINDLVLTGSAGASFILYNDKEQSMVDGGLDFTAKGGATYAIAYGVGPYVSAEVESQVYLKNKDSSSPNNDLDFTLSTGLGGVF